MTTISIKNLTINMSPGIQAIPFELGVLSSTEVAANAAEAALERYVVSANGKTVHDRRTGLTWDQAGTDKEVTEEEEIAYVASLNDQQHGGYSDWRRPDDFELCSIVDRTKRNPAINPVFACKSDWYRTTQPLVNTDGSESSGFAWFVIFGSGYVSGGHRGGRAFARAVRGPSPAGQ